MRRVRIFRGLSVSKRKTVTQMVDPLNFRFMDARLKNVASPRRDAARPWRVFSPLLPRARFSFLRGVLLSPPLLPFPFDTGNARLLRDQTRLRSLIGCARVQELYRKYNKPIPSLSPPSLLLASRRTRTQRSFANTSLYTRDSPFCVSSHFDNVRSQCARRQVISCFFWGGGGRRERRRMAQKLINLTLMFLTFFSHQRVCDVTVRLNKTRFSVLASRLRRSFGELKCFSPELHVNYTFGRSFGVATGALIIPQRARVTTGCKYPGARKNPSALARVPSSLCDARLDFLLLSFPSSFLLDGKVSPPAESRQEKRDRSL